MTKRRITLLLLCLPPALAGCSYNGAPGPLKPYTILQYSAADMTVARQSAASTCADYQQAAVLERMIVQNGARIAVFTCRYR